MVERESVLAERYDAAVERVQGARRALDALKVEQKLAKEELDAALVAMLRLRADDPTTDEEDAR